MCISDLIASLGAINLRHVDVRDPKITDQFGSPAHQRNFPHPQERRGAAANSFPYLMPGFGLAKVPGWGPNGSNLLDFLAYFSLSPWKLAS